MTSTMSQNILPTRSRVINLYKTLLFMGRDYPAGYQFFRERAHRAFMKNKDVTDPEAIEKFLKLGDYIVNELKAMYSLKKYRAMKQRYYEDQDDELLTKKLEKLVKESQGQQSQSAMKTPVKQD